MFLREGLGGDLRSKNQSLMISVRKCLPRAHSLSLCEMFS